MSLEMIYNVDNWLQGQVWILYATYICPFNLKIFSHNLFAHNDCQLYMKGVLFLFMLCEFSCTNAFIMLPRWDSCSLQKCRWTINGKYYSELLKEVNDAVCKECPEIVRTPKGGMFCCKWTTQLSTHAIQQGLQQMSVALSCFNIHPTHQT